MPPKTAAELVAEAKASVPTCTPAEAAKRLAADPKLVLVDLREPPEQAEARIARAAPVPRFSSSVAERVWRVPKSHSDSTVCRQRSAFTAAVTSAAFGVSRGPDGSNGCAAAKAAISSVSM